MTEIIIILVIIICIINLKLAHLTIAKHENWGIDLWITFAIISLIPLIDILITGWLFLLLQVDKIFNDPKKKKKKYKLRKILLLFNGELLEVPTKHFNRLKTNDIIKWNTSHNFYSLNKNKLLEWDNKRKIFLIKTVVLEK